MTGWNDGDCGPDDAATIDLIDAFCDAIPRRLARAEAHGPLVLFVSEGQGWPYYARPRRGSRETVTAAHLREVRARQRELGVPESFEWIAQNAPGLARAATAAGLDVAAHPLMVSTGRPADPAVSAGVSVRAVEPDEPDLASVVAVPDVAFGHPGTSPGSSGAIERDKLAAERDPASIARLRNLLASGHSVLVAAFGDEGALAAGSCQAVNGVAEITGVGTLPSARRCGLGAAVTARLAALAFDRGADTVFLSASDDAVAGIYTRIGFRRIGTAMIADPV